MVGRSTRGADDLAVGHDRHAAVDWHDARHCQQAKVSAPLANALRADGTPKKMVELDDDTALAISLQGPHGLVPYNKLKVLDMSMRYLGLYERDNLQRDESRNITLNIALVRPK